MSTASVGIFDSGVGGLTVLRTLQELLPHEDIIYFADTARLPYGMKSAVEIIQYSREILNWMQHEHQVKLVIVACNTSSALALEAVSGEFDLPVIGTIKPLVAMMCKQMPKRRIAVIATNATAQSKAFDNAFHLAGYNGVVHSIACPKFVPLIEAGQARSAAALKISRQYLSCVKEERLDTVVYGCTHYPWMEETLRRVLPPYVTFVDPSICMAQEAQHYLQAHHLLHTQASLGQVNYYTSGDPRLFAAQVSLLLAAPPPIVQQHKF